MLQAHPGSAVADAVWLDLLDPTEAERDQATRATGLALPTRAAISEIETSSRLRLEGEVFTLSTSVISRADDMSRPSVLGFVLSPGRMVTLRWSALRGLDAYTARLAADPPAPVPPAPAPPASGPSAPGPSAPGPSAPAAPASAPLGGMQVFVGLLEALVDRLADVLEEVGGELEAVSALVFQTDAAAGGRRRTREGTALRAILRRIGAAGDTVSRVRDSLLGLGRIAGFVPQAGAAWVPEALAPRFAALRTDIASLNDYDAQLTGKVQFLLDATLGFLNIAQNEGIKVLTVVSLVGIPPTLIASIYGMNFKNMPELSWSWGYPYALGLMAASVLGPLVFFKVRGWL